MKATLKKLKKELIFRFVAVLAVGMVIAAACLAWFTINLEVDIDGAKVKAGVTQNLVISDTPENLAATTNTEFTFDVEQKILKEATHDWNIGPNTGLAYLKNTGTVDAKKGLPTVTPVYQEVYVDPDTGLSRYYSDYTVCIGSLGASLPLAHLYASIAFQSGTDPKTVADYLSSLSVDFYIDSVSSANYRGTVNLAGYDYRNNGNVVTRVDFNTSADPNKNPIIIPHNKDVTKNCIKIVMRFYYDGGLKKVVDSTVTDQTYLYADNLSLNAKPICVSFVGVDPVTE